MSSVAEFDQANSPYRSPTTEAQDAVSDVWPEELGGELQAFVGPRAGYYLRKWAPRVLDPNGEVGMNWAAFFFTSFWFGYRKMYRAVFLVFAVVILVAVVESLIFMAALRMDDIPRGVNLVSNVLCSLICGLMANSWYLSHAQRAIATARAQGFEGDLLRFELSRRGGTSLLASFGLCFLGFLTIVFMAFAWFLLRVLSLGHV